MNFEQPPDNKQEEEASVEQELTPEEHFEECKGYLEEEKVQLEEKKKELEELQKISPESVRIQELEEDIEFLEGYLEEQMELWGDGVWEE